jgi:hypothetical protein
MQAHSAPIQRRMLQKPDMSIFIFVRLYGFHRRGGKSRKASAQLAMHAFNKEFN